MKFADVLTAIGLGLLVGGLYLQGKEKKGE